MSFKDMTISLAPWLGWVKYSNSKNLIKKLIKNNKYYDLLKRKTFSI